MSSPPPPPKPLRFPRFRSFLPPSSLGRSKDGSFDFLALADRSGGSTARVTGVEVFANGRTLIVTYEMAQPVNYGVPDWYPGKLIGATCSLSNGARLSFRSATCGSNVPAFQQATYTNSTQTITKTGAFANYRPWVSGDQIGITAPQPFAPNNAFTITARLSADSITVSPAFGADSAVVSSISMPAGQGTKLTWRAEFVVVDAASVITFGTAGVTFTASAGLLQDVYGNKSAPANAVPVVNNSIVDADGFTTAGFTPGTGGVTLYVIPGFGSNANTFTQAQNPATPYATTKFALDTLFAQGKNGTGSQVLIQQGTTDASANILPKVNGQDWAHPTLISSFWYAPAGVGTQGVRPILPGLSTSGGGGAPNNIGRLVVRGIDFAGTNVAGVGGVGISRSFTGVVLDDCIIRNWSTGVSMQSDFNNGQNMQDRCMLHRCIFRDIYAPGVTTEGLFSEGVSNLLVSQCHFDYCGRQNTDGAGSNTLSRAQYHSSASEHITIWGNYVSRSDGTQNRPGGSITDGVYTEVGIVGFVNVGRIARVYAEKGMDFGTVAFTNATYTHSTRTLAATGIGSTMTVPCTIWAASGTGVVAGQYRVATVNADSLVLSGTGLGAGADGSVDVGGVKQINGRGWGPQSTTGSDAERPQPVLIESVVMAYLNVYGSSPRGPEVPGKDSRYPRGAHVIVRNTTARQSGPILIDGSDALPPPRRLDRSGNLIDNRGTTLNVVSDGTNFATWAFLHSDTNAFLSDAATPFSVNGAANSLAQYQTLTGQEAASLGSGVPAYVNDGADLGAWAVQTGVGTTAVDLRNAIRTRAWDTWPTWADMSLCVDYMIAQYATTGVFSTYGAGSLDPAIYG